MHAHTRTVYWKTMPVVQLPSDIVKRFHNKPMAVIGLEWDQVRRTPKGDVSVPMNVAYNHHYGHTVNDCQNSVILTAPPTTTTSTIITTTIITTTTTTTMQAQT